MLHIPLHWSKPLEDYDQIMDLIKVYCLMIVEAKKDVNKTIYNHEDEIT
jgi:hypothetical protein